MNKLIANYAKVSFEVLTCSREDYDILSLFRWYLVPPRGIVASQMNLKRSTFLNDLESDPQGLLKYCRARALSFGDKREIRLERLVVMLLNSANHSLIVDFVNQRKDGRTDVGNLFFQKMRKVEAPRFKDSSALNVSRSNLLLSGDYDVF